MLRLVSNSSNEMSSPSFMSFKCLLMFFQLSLCFLTPVSHISVSRGYKILVEFIGGCGKLNLHSAFDFLQQVWECLWICLLTRISLSSGLLFVILQVIISSINDVTSSPPSHPYTGASSSQISIRMWGEPLCWYYCWFLLLLKGKRSIFGLSLTLCKSGSLFLTKTPLISKGTTPICKQEICK